MQNFFFIRHNGRSVKVSFADILYIEACKNYTKIVTDGKTHMALATMKMVEAVLPPRQFCRVHRGFIISLDKLSSFDRAKAYLPGHEISIGDRFRDELQKRVLVLDTSRDSARQFQEVYGAEWADLLYLPHEHPQRQP
jgi:DNA-binding LytR/AlgR family response regulator